MYMSEQAAVGANVGNQHESPYMQMSNDKPQIKFDPTEESTISEEKSPK